MTIRQVRFLSLLACAMLACALLLLSACGPANATVQEETVDPRFASAEALVEHFNSLNTLMPSNDLELLPLFHLENQTQRDMWKVIDYMTDERLYEINRLMYARFGASLDDLEGKRIPCTPAILKKVEEQRAEGTYHDELGKERPLHLIKVGNRWWVSGYTLEYAYDDHQKRDVDRNVEMVLSIMEEVSEFDTTFAIPVLERLRRGEFASADEVNQAYIEAIQRRRTENDR